MDWPSLSIVLSPERPILSEVLSSGRLRLLFLTAFLASCGGAALPPHTTLASDQRATSPSIGQRSTILGRDSLTYHVALTPKRIISVELTSRFALVIRDRAGISPQKRIDLAKADYDILDLVANPHNGQVYVASSAGWVRSYDVVSGERRSEWRMGSSATALAISDDARWLVIGTATGVLCLRRLRDGAQLQCVAGHQARVSALEISGETLASGDWAGSLAVWSLPSLREEHRVNGTGFLSALAWSPTGETLAVARNRRRPKRTPELNKAEKENPRVDPIDANVIELHSMKGQRSVVSLKGHHSVVSALAWTNTDLISTSWDRTVRIWNTRLGNASRVLLRLPHLASDVASARFGGEVIVTSWAPGPKSPSLTKVRLLYQAPQQ